MIVFKFFSQGYFYVFAAKTEEEAKMLFYDLFFDYEIEKTELIPESEWDKQEIAIWEDDNRDTDPFYVSIHDLICGEEPQFLYTNDLDE